MLQIGITRNLRKKTEFFPIFRKKDVFHCSAFFEKIFATKRDSLVFREK